MAYSLRIIDNPSDPTFNQLLSINDEGQIAGYYGSGAVGHPNKGYVTTTAATPVFKSENYPTSVQTQVTGINDAGVTVGFEVDAAGDSYGFVDMGGVFSIAVDALAPTLGGVVSEQFLGVNDHDMVAGFFVADAAGDTAGFVFNASAGAFTPVNVTGASSVSATDVNDLGEISGFFTEAGKTEGFVDIGGTIHALAGLAGWSDVQALGINDAGLVVGSYVDSKGNTDGFVYNLLSGVYMPVVEGAGTETVVNGVNNAGQLVGFYMDKSGNTHGMVLTPAQTVFDWVSKTLDDPADLTFNQLLSINNEGTIAGYFGSGAAGHPNKGYVLLPNHKTYVNYNYPGSVQTQATGIDNAGVLVGFEVDAAGNSAGFVYQGGKWQLAVDPSAPTIGGVVSEQFLGVNDRNEVAGFYVANSAGDTAGFVYNDQSGVFTNVAIAGATSVTATDVNDKGVISGFYTTSGGQTDGFIDTSGKILSIPGGLGDSNVQVLGLNNTGLAVGSFETGGVTEGFIYSLINGSFDAFTAPTAVGQTVLNGVNDLNQIVGFYMDKAGATHGLLVTSV